MAKEDYYAVLGIDRDTDADEIKKAYRRMAKEHHPDRNPDNPDADAEIKNINEAYFVLKDEQKRAAYDRFGHAAFEQGGSQAAGFERGFATGFADIFDEMFGDFMQGASGRGRGFRASGRGADLRYSMGVSLEDAFNGKKTTIRVSTSVPCDDCKGTGAAGAAAPVSCRHCGGRGRVRAQSGFFTIERTCPSCGGAGQVIKEPCRNCGGAGRVEKEKSLSVNIPSGIEDGTRIRLGGEGEAGLRGAPPGDLYIFITVAPHRIFQREGADIYCRVPIPMTTATLGGSIDVPTVDGGRARVNIPAGSQSGQQFRLRNKGMTVLRSASRGDMFVQAMVETPVSLTRKQKDLLKEFEDSGSREKQSPESHGFFSKVKELWEDIKE